MKRLLLMVLALAGTGCALRGANAEALVLESDEPTLRLVDFTAVARFVECGPACCPPQLALDYALHVENSHWEREYLIFEAEALKKKAEETEGGTPCEIDLN